MVGSALISATGDPLMPAYYMMAACLVGLVALHYMPETAGRSLRDDPFRR
jgi:MHS family proline/betaine transporter-like MFS transporter